MQALLESVSIVVGVFFLTDQAKILEIWDFMRETRVFTL